MVKPSNKSKSPATTPTPQNIKIKGSWGGRREGSGKPQRKPGKWPRDIDLKAGVDVDRLLCLAVKRFWSENVLDARALSALNGVIRLLLDHRRWMDPQLTPWDDPVSYGDEDEDSEEEEDSQPEITKQQVDATLNDLKDQMRQKEQEYATRAQALIDNPEVAPEVKAKAQKLLENIKEKQDQSA